MERHTSRIALHLAVLLLMIVVLLLRLDGQDAHLLDHDFHFN